MIYTQSEFPFTRVGAFQSYQDSLYEYMNRVYQNYIIYGSGIKDRKEFLVNWLKSPLHTCYAQQHSKKHFENCVENQNDEVIRRWNENTLVGKLK